MSYGSSPSRRVDPYFNDVSQEMLTKAMDDLSLTDRLRRVLNDVVLYRQLLRSKGTDAQALLDTFQSILDSSELDSQFQRLLIVATQRLSRTSGLYPVCYELRGVKQEYDPVTAGGFADIYKGEFEGHVVCLKAIRLYQDSQVEHLLKQFSREVILWGQLSHANVLPMYGLYRYKKRLCFVAPWMENGDIATYLKQNPDADRYSLARDVARGLKYLHMHGIIHGDLKSPNVLVDDSGRARLCDFGISSVSDPAIVAWTSLSTMSSKGGSLRWQAPELFDTEDDESVRNSTLSDVYALGCVYYEIFTGNLPFYSTVRDSSVIVLIQRGSRPLRPLESSPAWRDWGLTETTWALMQDCWSTQPSERPTIDQVINRLSLPLHQTPSRKAELRDVLSPTRFRDRIKEPLNETTKSILDRLLCNVVESAKQNNNVVISASSRLHRISPQKADMPGSEKSARRNSNNDIPKISQSPTPTTSIGNGTPCISTTGCSSGASVSSSVKTLPSTDVDLLKASVVTVNDHGGEDVQDSACNLDSLEPTSVIEFACTSCGTTHSPLWSRGPDGDLICEDCVQFFKLYVRLRPKSIYNTHDEPLRIFPDQELTSIEYCHICYTTDTPFWRRDNQGKTICSACGLYYQLHGSAHPYSEKSNINRKRSRHDDPQCSEDSFFDMSPNNGSISSNDPPANDSYPFPASEVASDEESTNTDVIHPNKRRRLSTGELQSTGVSYSMYDLTSFHGPSMHSVSQHPPMLLPDGDETKLSSMPQDYNLDFTGIEALPMVRSTDESPTGF